MPYVTLGTQRVWHEIAGDGEPLVLLHGAFAGASSFAAQTPAFAAAGFRVHVPERRGHAHTPDVPGTLSYQSMADDTIEYLDTVLGGARAHLVGWSDGAVVALLVARVRPDLVHRLVLIGQYYNSSGKVPDTDIDQLLGSPEAVNFLRGEYDQVSPDGADHFPVVYEKIMQMLRTEPEIDLATLHGVSAPTLVVQGDRDEVTLAHSAEVVARLGDARLAVLPGTHLLPVECPQLFNPLVIEFLRGTVPQAGWQHTEGSGT